MSNEVRIVVITEDELRIMITEAVRKVIEEKYTGAVEELPEYFSEKQLRERYQISRSGIRYLERTSKLLQPTYIGGRKRYKRDDILKMERDRALIRKDTTHSA